VQALHGAVISLVLSVATWSVVIVWLALALGSSTLWYWQRWVRVEPAHSAALYAVGGLLAIATLPYVVHATVFVHDFAARRMLGEWRVTALRRDAARSETSRESAILAEDSSLRRLERDIHDGPQQGLLRIQFDLASAGRALEPQHPALPLVHSALRVAAATLTELRELARGLAPPLLQDRGLESAVRALAARSEVRVTTTFTSIEDPGIADLERSVYFIVSELLSNVAKHSEATSAHVSLVVEPGTDGRRRLVVKISDNGIGGASLVEGHGLEGLNQRIIGLRGALVIDSPQDGPSQFTVEIPLR
jgi:signal transduction histidine kinase